MKSGALGGPTFICSICVELSNARFKTGVLPKVSLPGAAIAAIA